MVRTAFTITSAKQSPAFNPLYCYIHEFPPCVAKNIQRVHIVNVLSFWHELFFAFFDLINKNCFISLFTMTNAILIVIT